MDRKKTFWAIASAIITGFTIWAVISQSKNFSFKTVCAIIERANKIWLLAAIACMFGFIWFEGVAIRCILDALGCKKKRMKGLLYSGADIYFSAITPSASGGQPATAYFMMKDQIPLSTVTVVLLANLVIYTLALLFLGLLNMIFMFPMFLGFDVISQTLIVAGFVLLLGLALSFYGLLKRPVVLKKLYGKLLHFLNRIHLIKKTEKHMAKLEHSIQEYAECSRQLFGKGRVLATVFLWDVLQRISQFAVNSMVFLALGMSPKAAWEACSLQCFVAVGSNCIPLPGGVGVADYMLMNGLRGLTDEEMIVHTELLCRGITFYGSVITGLLIVLIGRAFMKKNK